MNEILKVGLYVLVDFFPNMILGIIPFQKFMRHRKSVFGVSVVAMYVILVVCRVLSLISLTFAAVFSVGLIFVYLGFYRVNFSVKLSKLMFVLLILLNYGSFVGIIHTHISNRIVDNYARDQYAYAANGILGIITALSFPFMRYMMAKKIRPLMTDEIDNKVWGFLWVIPATSCLAYYYSLFAGGGILVYSENIRNVLFAVVLNLVSLLVTFIVAHLVRESNDQVLLRIENYKLNLQNLQYENLQNRIDETRRARHDLRQIITVIQACLKDEDTERLKTYIANYTKTLPADTPMSYCENYAVNALILYYADQCRCSGIDFQVSARYPPDSAVAETDAVILLGNLVENAVEACRRQEYDPKVVKLNIQSTDDSVIITIDNTHDGKVNRQGKGFASSKGERTGIGIATIQNIAARYNGIVKFECDDLMFHSSVLLQLN